MTRLKDNPIFHLSLSTLLILSVLSSPLFAEEDAVPRVRPVESSDVLQHDGIVHDSLVPPKSCVPRNIACGEIGVGQLDSTDCTGDEAGVRVDMWEFSGQAGSRVEINATSDDFDTLLILFSPDTNFVVVDYSRIALTLGSSGTWTIWVTNYNAFELGDYLLSLECGPGSGGCQPSATVLCLRNGRFQIESGRTGQEGYLLGTIVDENEGSAVTYFSSDTKWELMVNVQPRGDRYWFSASGLTEGREYDIVVRDLVTGQGWQFTLPDWNPRVTNAPLSFISP